jgi:flagellar hook-associated protein 3 FlgL
MRVTSNTLPNALVNQLGSLLARQTRLQNQASSGQLLQTAADDPATAARVFSLQAQAASLAQYRRNIASQQEVATSSYDAIKSLKNICDRASEIAVSADSLHSPEQLAAYAKEVTQLIQQGVQLANAKNGSNYLFGGTQTAQPPFVLSTDANGVATAVSFAGNATLPKTEVDAGVTFTASTAGANPGATGPRGLLIDGQSGADFFQHLIALQNRLATSDTAAVTQTVQPQLLQDEENFVFHMSSNAATQARLEASAADMTNRAQTLDSQISHHVDADLTETLVRLNQTQDAYKVALQSGASMLQLSLLDYLR